MFELDKDIIIFDLNPSDLPDHFNGYGRSESTLIVTNISDKLIAIRVNI